MTHEFKKKMASNDLSMCWVLSEKCIHCGVEKKSAGKNEVCPKRGCGGCPKVTECLGEKK